MVHCSLCSICAPAVVYGRLIKWGQPGIATKGFSCEGLLLAHLFYSHPKQKSKTIHTGIRISRPESFAMNNCHDFQGLFYILFSQFLNLSK